jgi:soluble lytic murein transglycosylase-like protein
VTEQPEHSATAEHEFDIRHGDDRRSGAERRKSQRTTAERRLRQRRRSHLRSLLMTAVTLVVPNPVKHGPVKPLISAASVRVSSVPSEVDYDRIIREAAALYDLDEALIHSVIEVESAFNTAAVSPAGALGLMQLMPALAAELGVERPFDARQNIMGGARYLRLLLDRHRGNVKLALASYNAGPSAVARYGRVPPYPETQRYVKKITRLLAKKRT